MITYPRYFYEWDLPIAGIDTISIWIHPHLIKDHSAFKIRGNANESINLRIKKEKDHIAKKTIRTNYIMDIQAEAINPAWNILYQIYEYIAQLFHSGILYIRNTHKNFNYHLFIAYNFNQLFSIDFIDFYFDIKEEDAILCGQVNKNYPNTQYTSDSSIKTYNRANRLKQKNTISHCLIDKMVFSRRIEFHLTWQTCRYLSNNNICGTFDQIFLKYLHFLARKWLRYKKEIIDIPKIISSDYYYLKQIEFVAFANKIPHNKALEKSPLKPIPYNRKGKDNLGNEWFVEFITEEKLPEIQG
jgi:hypothetical protein